MNDLIKALKIFKKYTGNLRHPTVCNHDILYVMCDPAIVSKEDKDILETLGFYPGKDDNRPMDYPRRWASSNFYSYRFGSA